MDAFPELRSFAGHTRSGKTQGSRRGKDEEFYHRAERELEEELSQREKDTPRNLWSSFAIPFPLQRPNYRPSQ